MSYFDKEINIIKRLQNFDSHDIYFINNENESKKIFTTIYDINQWINWIDSSGKNAPPPDFYNDELKLMMDVMRIDDHAFQNKKNKIINPTLALESKIYNELKNKNIFSEKTLNNIFIIANTDLPTNKDHNYNFYYQNFKRVLLKHDKKIDLYKKNHPNFKTIFLIFDESSAYFELIKNKKNGIMQANVHLHFFDEKFVSIIKEIKADYIIWMTPYKKINVPPGSQNLSLPYICIFDTNLPNEIKTLKYKENRMKSFEL